MATRRITLKELLDMLEDDEITAEDLEPYVMVNEAASGMFNQRIIPNPATVILPGQSGDFQLQADLVLRAVNDYQKDKRNSIFEKRKSLGYRPLIVAEGDSWFQFPRKPKDTIDHLIDRGYAIKCLSAAGDTLAQMRGHEEYINVFRETGATIFMLSGGGNDVLGGGDLKRLLKPYAPRQSAEWHINDNFDVALNEAIDLYRQILSVVLQNTGVTALIHGYDYVIPNGGRWLGEPMADRNITDPRLQREIARVMIERFNGRLSTLPHEFPGRVVYVNQREAVGDLLDEWFDELHPNTEGYGRVAARFHDAISALLAAP